MSIKYFKLFDLLNRKGYKKTDLYTLANISTPTLAKLSKGENITTETIDKICEALDCQPGDIMEFEPNIKIITKYKGLYPLSTSLLFNDGFMSRHTKFNTFQEFLSAAGINIDIDNIDEVKALARIKNRKLNAFVKKNSDYSDFKEMFFESTDEFAEEYDKQRL